LSRKINPYYNPEKLGLTCESFDEQLSYEYNTLCFFFTDDGRVYSAQDSGCSCPIPFENYEGETQEEVLRMMDRVGSVEQGMREYDSFQSAFRYKHTDVSERLGLQKKLESVFC